MGIQDLLNEHPAIGGLVGGVVVGAASVGIVNILRGRSKAKAKSKTSSKKRASTRKAKTRRKTSKSRSGAFQKRRARAFRNASSKKIFHTKNGQPYIKLKSGKARFIKKSSASSRKKRKGGFR